MEGRARVAPLKCWIGIDPGKSGALAVLWSNGKIEIEDYDPLGSHIETFKAKKPYLVMAVLERVASMPRDGHKGAFTFGSNFGWWQGVMQALEIPYITVPPQTWMKGIVGKDGCMVAAKNMFPSANLWGPRGGPKDGRADALLMAHYCQKQRSA